MQSANLTHNPAFSLDNFEGTLELLLYLIQKQEVDVCDVTIQQLTQQLIDAADERSVEVTAELMGLAATILLIKSQKLLPDEEVEGGEPIEDPRIEMIEKLIEYCRFKDTAKTLLVREQEQKIYFPRAAPTFRKELGDGLEEVGLESLQQIMSDLLKRAEKQTQTIPDEEWHISPKISWLKEMTQNGTKLPFNEVFGEGKCRGELIVSFLALLELMKLEEARVVRENETLYIVGPHEHQSS